MTISGIVLMVDDGYKSKVPEVARMFFPHKRKYYDGGRLFTDYEAKKIVDYIHENYRDRRKKPIKVKEKVKTNVVAEKKHTPIIAEKPVQEPQLTTEPVQHGHKLNIPKGFIPIVLPGHTTPVVSEGNGKWVGYKQQLVYFILAKEFGRVKIGITNKPWQRLNMLRTGCPTNLSVLLLTTGGLNEERRLQELFRKYHVINEWFEYGDEIREYVESLRASATDLLPFHGESVE